MRKEYIHLLSASEHRGYAKQAIVGAFATAAKATFIAYQLFEAGNKGFGYAACLAGIGGVAYLGHMAVQHFRHANAVERAAPNNQAPNSQRPMSALEQIQASGMPYIDMRDPNSPMVRPGLPVSQPKAPKIPYNVLRHR